MGSSSSILHLGASADPLQFQNGEGASWTTENLTRDGATCTDYKNAWSDTVYGTYDDRNSQESANDTPRLRTTRGLD